MDTEQQRGFLFQQRLGGGDISQHHELFDQLMRVEPFAEVDRFHFAIVTQLNPAFR